MDREGQKQNRCRLNTCMNHKTCTALPDLTSIELIMLMTDMVSLSRKIIDRECHLQVTLSVNEFFPKIRFCQYIFSQKRYIFQYSF